MTGLVERLRDALEAFKDAPGHRWVDLTVNVGPDGDLPILNRAYVTLEDLREIAARIEALEAGLRAILEANDAAVTAMLECTDDDEAMRLASIRGVTFGAVIEDARALLASLLLSSGGGGSARVSLTAAGSDLATPGKDGVSR